MLDARPQGQMSWVSYTAYIRISSTDAMQRQEETGICSVCVVHSPAIHEYASVFTFRRANVISVHGLEGNVHVRKPVDVRVTLDPNLGSDGSNGSHASYSSVGSRCTHITHTLRRIEATNWARYDTSFAFLRKLIVVIIVSLSFNISAYTDNREPSR